MNSNEEDEQVHPKMTEAKVTTQQKDTVVESTQASRTTAKVVNLDHTKEFQECMSSNKVGNGIHPFDMIALAIAFYECNCNVCLVVTKSSAQTCSCGRWQEYKYPCRYAMAYFKKGEDMSYPDILHLHVHDYYKNKSMQQIYGCVIFPVVQDQIRYNDETNNHPWKHGNQDDPKETNPKL